MSGEWKSLTLPLTPQRWAVLSFHWPMSRPEYVRLVQLLDAMMDGLVEDAATVQPADLRGTEER